MTNVAIDGNLINGYRSIATAAGTTTLTVSDANTQVFTGSTTQNCDMPAVSTLVLGTMYKIVNLSSGVVTVRSSGGNTIQAMQANSTLMLVSNATSGTNASVWYVLKYVPAASGQTGSGSLVRATSPSLVTPTLGVADATSINFGQDALNYYDEGTFTPVFTIETPGDLSVSYITQSGIYTRIGKVVTARIALALTPTFTTATGNLRITGMPFTSSGGGFNVVYNTGVAYAGGRTHSILELVASTTFCQILVLGSSASGVYMINSDISSGAIIQFYSTLVYYVS